MKGKLDDIGKDDLEFRVTWVENHKYLSRTYKKIESAMAQHIANFKRRRARTGLYWRITKKGYLHNWKKINGRHSIRGLHRGIGLVVLQKCGYGDLEHLVGQIEDKIRDKIEERVNVTDWLKEMATQIYNQLEKDRRRRFNIKYLKAKGFNENSVKRALGRLKKLDIVRNTPRTRRRDDYVIYNWRWVDDNWRETLLGCKKLEVEEENEG